MIREVLTEEERRKRDFEEAGVDVISESKPTRKRRIGEEYRRVQDKTSRKAGIRYRRWKAKAPERRAKIKRKIKRAQKNIMKKLAEEERREQRRKGQENQFGNMFAPPTRRQQRADPFGFGMGSSGSRQQKQKRRNNDPFGLDVSNLSGGKRRKGKGRRKKPMRFF